MTVQEFRPRGALVVPAVSGLKPYEQHLLDQLVAVWSEKVAGNRLRQDYVDGNIPDSNLGIAVPDEISRTLRIVCGWPEKAVYGLANLCVWNGVVSPSGSEDPFELNELLRANRFDVDISQTIAAQLTHSVAFITTTPGDVYAGEPEVLIMPHSAQWASALWDYRRRMLKAGFVISDIDEAGYPCACILYTRDAVVELERHGFTWAVSSRLEHSLGRPLMEALPYRATLDRPFGRSRVSGSVMTITDRAVRAILRMDLASELYTSPGLLLRGIEEDTFHDIAKSWSWRMGTVKGISRDDDGLVPEVDSLPQASITPYIEQIRELATEFAGVTALPVSTLGVIADNPSSADAIYAAKEELVIEASANNRANSHALRRVYQNAVMLRDDTGEMSEELAQISTRWRNPSMPSVVSQADAMVKQIAAIPALALTDVALEELGYTDEQILRIRAQIRSADANAFFNQPPQATGKATEEDTQTPPSGSSLKEKFDALGVAIRAGVKPDNAARLVGLDGVEFTGMIPVSLKTEEGK